MGWNAIFIFVGAACDVMEDLMEIIMWQGKGETLKYNIVNWA